MLRFRTRLRGGAFGLDAAIRALFAASEQGAWYDPSDWNTLYQDSAGTTPVTATGQPVGFIGDKRNAALFGPEKVTNGTFDTDLTGWAVSSTMAATATVVNGEAQITSTATYGRWVQPITCVVGKVYRLTATVRRISGATQYEVSVNNNAVGNAFVTGAWLTGTSSTNVTIAGTFTATQATHYLAIGDASGSGSTFAFDNISVKEWLGNHATQSTAASRPVLQQDASGRYCLAFDGVDDFLVTNSIDFSATDKLTLLTGVRKLSDSGRSQFIELGTSSAVAGSFGVTIPESAGGEIGPARNGGLGNGARTAPVSAAPSTFVLATTFNLAGVTAATENPTVRVNAASPALTNIGLADTGTGPFANQPLYIGRRGGTSFPFNGRLYSLIVRGALSDADQIAQAESYVNQKTGAY